MVGRARTLSAAVLCAAVIVALVMIVLATSQPASAVPPMEVSLDFDTFVPGVRQTRTSVVDVPVSTSVRDAGIVHSSGLADDIDWTFELCERSSCRPLVPGTSIEPGAYRLQVSAVLAAESVAVGEGRVVGRVLLAESSTTTGATFGDRTSLVWWSASFLIVMVIAATAIRQLRLVRS